MKKRVFMDEGGSALPIVTLLLVFIILGICALVFDAGILYSERRNMVTAADAAALAGAMIMEESLTSQNEATAIIEAESVAKEVALTNGIVDVSDITIEWSNPDYERSTITVYVKNTKDLFFARFLGFQNTEVAAKAVATWGFITKMEHSC